MRERRKEPGNGSEIEPETVRLQAVEALCLAHYTHIAEQLPISANCSLACPVEVCQNGKRMKVHSANCSLGCSVEAVCRNRQAHDVCGMGRECATACLLKNDPAS